MGVAPLQGHTYWLFDNLRGPTSVPHYNIWKVKVFINLIYFLLQIEMSRSPLKPQVPMKSAKVLERKNSGNSNSKAQNKHVKDIVSIQTLNFNLNFKL